MFFLKANQRGAVPAVDGSEMQSLLRVCVGAWGPTYD